MIVHTVQGIGDIFWCYQKLAPYVDSLDLRILCVSNNEVQHRAKAFCEMLPKVASVKYVCGPPSRYGTVSRSRYDLLEVLSLGAVMPVDYAVNAPLEQGIPLRQVDPGMAIEEYVSLRGVPDEAPPQDDYLCLFVAGAKTGDQYSAVRWALAAARLARRLGTDTVRIIGAGWDLRQQEELPPHLNTFNVHSHIGAALPETIDIIRRSRFFFGYQSGLNVLADNYDVPQLMVYYNKLRLMQYTWPKPANVRTRFHAMTFGESPQDVIEALPQSLFERMGVTT